MSPSGLDPRYASARRWVIAGVTLSTALIAGALILLPGPAFLVNSVAAAVLGIEVTWARRWLRDLRERATGADDG